MILLIFRISFFKKLYKWTYLQNRNRLTDIENKFMVTKTECGGMDKSRALGLTYTHICKIDN